MKQRTASRVEQLRKAQARPVSESGKIAANHRVDENNGSDDEHPVKFIVRGRVRLADSSPVEGAVVKAFDKDMRAEQVLGEPPMGEGEKKTRAASRRSVSSGGKPTTTDKLGQYEIRYTDEQFRRAEKERADLIVRAYAVSGELLAESPVIFNADPVEEVDLVVGAGARSEFESLVIQLAPLMEGVPQHELTPQDVAFLAGETGLEARFITLLAESARRHVEADSVPQTAFYGLFRQNHPTALKDLLAPELTVLRAALEASSAERIIPPLSQAALDEAINKLRVLKAELLLEPGGGEQPPSLGDLLQTSQLPTEKQQVVAELQVLHDGASEAFWDALGAREDFSEQDVGEVRLTLELGELTSNYVPLVRELRSAGAEANARPLAARAMLESVPAAASIADEPLRPLAGLEEADWKGILLQPQPNGEPVGAPEGTPGDTLEERVDNYAAALAAHMESALPTPAIAGRLQKDTAEDNPFRPVRADLETFFGNNPAFAFEDSPVPVYLSEGRDEKLKDVQDPAALVTELTSMQRLFNVAPRYREMRALYADGLHSAQGVVLVGEKRFVEDYANILGGPQKVLEIYRNAERTHATALNVYMKRGQAFNQPLPYVLGGGTGAAPAAPLSSAASTPDLPILFGSLDLCDCSHCKSLYSPAAYLADILNFLRGAPSKEGKTPLEVLLERRPDLEHIELDCENTNTPLPYVDLVNEILEAAVLPRGFDVAEGADIATVLSELAAGRIATSLANAFGAAGYPLTAKASVRAERDGRTSSATDWVILDAAWAFTLGYQGSNEGFRAQPWPQTSWTADELRAHPEHLAGSVYAGLRNAVFPWKLPFHLAVEEMRVYLEHLGVPRAELMETLFRGSPAAALSDAALAYERLGMLPEEAAVITGATIGGTAANPGAWDFWGLQETGNSIPDPTDGTAAPATGDWHTVLQHVSIFLQQSGVAYQDLLELLGSYFVNPAAGSGRTLAIVSTDSQDPATCRLSRLEMRVHSSISDTGVALKNAWKRAHRFIRLQRRMGWSIRDLDRAISAMQPTDLNAAFLVQLSHVERLRAETGLPVPTLFSWWGAIDTGRYFDHSSDEERVLPSLYAQLFNNKTAAGQSLPEDPAALAGQMPAFAAAIAGALEITVDELTRLRADPNVISNADLTLQNLSRLYRHATLAAALKLPIPQYLTALALVDAAPFSSTERTVRFAQRIDKIRGSGFSIADLDYLLRHQEGSTSETQPDEAIVAALDTIRDDLRKAGAENAFVDASVDANAATADPSGELTRKKLAALNWDGALVEQIIAVLGDSFTHESPLSALPGGVVFPEALRNRLSYDATAARLRFTGTMSAATIAQLDALTNDTDFRSAVQDLFDAPRDFVARHMARFSVPSYQAALATLPANLAFPESLKSRIFYDTVAKKLRFLGVMTRAERRALEQLSTDAAYTNAVKALFEGPTNSSPAADDVFLTSTGTGNDVALLFDDPAMTPPGRFLLVLKKLLPYLRRALSERAVKQRLGEYLRLDAGAVDALVRRWVNSPSNASRNAADELLDAAFADSNPNIKPDRAAFPAQFDTVLLLGKIASLGRKLGMSARQLGWVFDLGPAAGWLDPNALPLAQAASAHTLFEGWERLADLVRLRDALPDGETVLSGAFSAAGQSGAQLASVFGALSAGVGWPLADLQDFTGASGFNLAVGAFKDERAMLRLAAAFSVLGRLGASAAQALLWTQPSLSDANAQLSAREIKSLAKAKQDAAQWLQTAKALRDPLREKQRAALVSCLMAARGAREANELYDDFLIDVEMSPCMLTTRIKQAIGSVQLFVQRSLMNLEPQVALSAAEARQWARWRRQYRIWEANRKVLFYPENWIQPELRDDKSPFYREFENELQQSDVTIESAEAALLHYLEKLNEVARLEIVGMYRQSEPTNSIDVLHVVGRTLATPHVHYYRRRVNAAYWTAWEKIEADIQDDHVLPLIWNRRLYLFWPSFTQKQKDRAISMPQPGGEVQRGERYLEIRMAWSEHRGGKWSAKRLSAPMTSDLKHPEAPLDEKAFRGFTFKSRIEHFGTDQQELFIDCYGPLNTVVTTPAVPGGIHERLLFSLLRGKSKDIVATVSGGSFKASDVAKVEIVGRKSDGGEVERFRLATDGTGGAFNTHGTTVKYYVVSSVYVAGQPVLQSAKVECEIDPETKTKLCEIVTEALCRVDLAPAPVQGPTTSTLLAPVQPVASFGFDDARDEITPLLVPATLTALEPIVGTRFENQDLVEYEDGDDGLGQSRMLRKTPGFFRLLGMHQSNLPKAVLPPAFYQDDAALYFIAGVQGTTKLAFHSHHHARVRDFVRALNRSGIDGLLTLANQRLTDAPNAFSGRYDPDPARIDITLLPRADVDFGYDAAYAPYNWELFFHAPLAIALQLGRNQRFEEAQKWFHYIFDPTSTDSPDRPANPGPERFWRVKPFYDETLVGIQTLAELMSDTASLQPQIAEWQANPFRPHAIARLRVVAYMKAVVMAYIDNLVAWGDQLFRRDTIESINEATQLYILAAQILGPRPSSIPPRARAQSQTFRTLDDRSGLNDLSNALVEIEGFLPPSAPPASGTGTEGGALVMPFFCLPSNDRLLGYWDTVADRLFKIRHCMNIEGTIRSLPAFGPPIEPGLLVKAAAAGVDISSALRDVNAALPHYRFSLMLQKAVDLCADVRALGGALLSALEKRDAEALALLRSGHELKLLAAVRAIKESQLNEAKAARKALDHSKAMATIRRDYYRDIAFMNPWEFTHTALAGTALGLQAVEVVTHALAGTLFLIPNLKVGAPTSLGVTYGGENVGPSIREFSESTAKVVSLLNAGGAMAATMGGYWRRFDEWKLQERLAEEEIQQIDRQIAAADLRLAVAEKDLANHDLQTENAREADAFMREKFTNRELYDWMVGQLSAIYFQSYQLAYDVAKRAERAYRYELGLRDSGFIRFGYWDSLKKGLLAGERLHYDLKRMDLSYLDQNRREYEITKHVSLSSLDALALARLKQAGECFISLPEALFDLDHPGHYMRRIRSVAISVPCVTGPYTGINCTLTLLNSTLRHANTLATGKYARQADDARFSDSHGAVQSIVASSGQSDSGLFDGGMRDERYLPFEGQGVVSSWRIELPKQFRPFDYATISDVILHVRYTAREGGGSLGTQALAELKAAVNQFVRSEGQKGLALPLSLRHEFPTEWHRFLNPPPAATGDQSLTLSLTKERFPFLFQEKTVALTAIQLYAKVNPQSGSGYNASTLKLSLQPGTAASNAPLALAPWNGLLLGSKSPAGGGLGSWTLAGWLEQGTGNNVTRSKLDVDAIDDIIAVCTYTVS